MFKFAKNGKYIIKKYHLHMQQLMRARSIILLSSDLLTLFFSTGKPVELFGIENPDWAPTQHLDHDVLVKASSSDEKTIAEKTKPGMKGIGRGTLKDKFWKS